MAQDTKKTTTKDAGRSTSLGDAASACPVALCPVGMFMTLAGQARPEVVEHLLNAGREMMLAASALLSARADAASEKPRLERIDVE